jgi:hypothetical protein
MAEHYYHDKNIVVLREGGRKVHDKVFLKI